MNPVVKNLFANLPGPAAQEDFLTLAQMGNGRVERIVSNGQRSPKDFWYDQPENEWVLLLQGRASLQFEDGHIVRLKAGDYLLIASHTKHRVEETSPDSIWLVVYYTSL
jgi:cupin 2 domain-containing protein